jgi:hypothetical protein
MKNSLEMLKRYSDMIAEAEQSPDTFNTNDFIDGKDKSTEPTDNEDSFDINNNNDNPVDELADYINNYPDDNTDVSEIIFRFLKEKNYQLVPIGGLENSTGNV